MDRAKPGERTRVDELADRFECDWRAGLGPRIEDYLQDLGGPGRVALLEGLVRVERELRAGSGEAPSADEYRARFPGNCPEVDAAFVVAGRPATAPGIAPADAARSLLFGILALQNNFIGRDDLLAAFNVWVASKSRSIGQVLRDRGALSPARYGLLEGLVQEHLDQHGGDVERSLAVISILASVRDGLEGVADLDLQSSLLSVRIADTETVGVAEATANWEAEATANWEAEATANWEAEATANWEAEATASPADAQGRFRIVRFHDRGALGEVFVARDQQMNRIVALKRIQAGKAASPDSRARFVVEAEVTGRLEHPGIVPVYGLGTDPGGRPFYAMRFIRGDNLKSAIDDFHREERGRDPGERSLALLKLLRRFLDVCNAIDYAHSRGVLHRDLKPGNIMLGKFGETMVVDWGLAKAVGRPDDAPAAAATLDERTLVPKSGSGLQGTEDGSRLGTPAYMSPEQAAGRIGELGPASDVYSLGATLYCLLTGNSPFEGTDLGELLRKVGRGDFPPPRQLKGWIDPALEAVCLKAMAVDSAGRYSTPRGLADDIEHWLADEPVSAWREPWPRRLSRWVARHRTGMAAAAAAVLAGVVGLGVVLAVQSAANARLAESLRRETAANAALASANAALEGSRAAVQARYELAVEAIKTFHTGVSEEFLLKEGQFKGLRNRLLTSAADFYGRLGALLGRETDFASRRALARSNFELADLTGKIDLKKDALAMHRAVLAAREGLAAEPEADIPTKTEVGRSLTEVASLLDLTGKGAESLATYRRSESLLSALPITEPAARAALADCRTKMALQLYYSGRAPEGLEALQQARADQEMLASMPGASVAARRELAETLAQIGFIHWSTGKPSEAEPAFREMMAAYQKLARENLSVIEFHRGLAASHFYRGNVLLMIGKPTEAEVELRTGLKQSEVLSSGNPAINRLLRNLGLQHSYLGELLVPTGRPEEAAAEYRRAWAVFEKLLDNDPTDTKNRSAMARCRGKLGILLFQMGRPIEAEVECRTSVETLQKLADDNPTTAVFRDELSQALLYLGDMMRSFGRLSEAKRAYEQSIAIYRLRVQEEPSNMWSRFKLACSLRRRGLTFRDLGNPSGAVADVSQALALCEGLPTRSGYEFETACCRATLAGLAARAGSGITPAEREAEADLAMQWLRLAVSMGYQNANEIRVESALDPLRSRDDFHLLMMDLAFPADPFAR